jgi:hypothetical protein
MRPRSIETESKSERSSPLSKREKGRAKKEETTL